MRIFIVKETRAVDDKWFLEHQADNSDIILLSHLLKTGLSFWVCYIPNTAFTHTGSRVLSEDHRHPAKHRMPIFSCSEEINETQIKINLTVQRGEIWQQSKTQVKSQMLKETFLTPCLMCVKHHFQISNWQPWLRWTHTPACHHLRDVMQRRTGNTSSKLPALLHSVV